MKISTSTLRAVAVLGMVLASVAALGCSTPEPPTPTPSPPIIVEIGMTTDRVMAPLNIDFEAVDFTDGVSYFWDFGDGNTAAGTIARHTYLDAGAFVIRLSGTRDDQTEYAEKTITVQPGDAGWIVLNASELAIEANQSFQFEAEAFDHLGNTVPDAQLVWYADPAVGTIDQSGLFTAGQDLAVAAEGVRVDFPRGNFTANEKLPVAVVLGEPDEISVTPDVIETRATWGVDLNAEVLDAAGHVIEDAEITWEVLRPGDDVDQTGYYTPSETISAENASLVLLTATHGDSKLERIVKGTVNPGILDRIEVEGSLLELKTGDEVQLSAKGFDRFDNELELDDISWEVDDPDVGSFDADGVFTASGKSGEFPEDMVRVRGFKDGVQVFALVPISVLPSKAVSIEFVNEIDSVPAGSSAPIPLRVLDEHGNAITDIDVYLEVTAGGTLTTSNVFKAGFELGMYEDAVIARVLAEDTANGTLLEESTNIEVRQRSADYLAVDVVGPGGPVVYLINLANGDLTPISEEAESNEFIEDTPSWWHDGSRLVYSSDASGVREIYDIEPFTGEVRQLVTGENDLFMPAISPDSTKIAFVESTDSGSHIFVADLELDENGGIVGAVNAADARQLSSEDGIQNLFPYWSPDGDSVMFTSSNSEGRFRVTVADVAEEFGDVLVEARAASGLAWHPDGMRILVSTEFPDGDGTRDALVLADLTTGDIEEIDVGGLKVGIAAIAPDGSEMSFVDEEEGALWLMDLDGTGRRRALGGQFQPTLTAWRPQPLEPPTPTSNALADTAGYYTPAESHLETNHEPAGTVSMVSKVLNEASQ